MPHTISDFRLRSMIVAPEGWRAVYMLQDGSRLAEQLDFIGPAEVWEQDVRNGKVISERFDMMTIAGITVMDDGDTSICNEADNFCGIARPDVDIAKVMYEYDSGRSRSGVRPRDASGFH